MAGALDAPVRAGPWRRGELHDPAGSVARGERDEVLAHLAASSGLSARIKRQLKSGGGKRLVDAIQREAKSRVRRM